LWTAGTRSCPSITSRPSRNRSCRPISISLLHLCPARLRIYGLSRGLGPRKFLVFIRWWIW
jgi:hypothetical protein